MYPRGGGVDIAVMIREDDFIRGHVPFCTDAFGVV